jgi:hypothetical protein
MPCALAQSVLRIRAAADTLLGSGVAERNVEIDPELLSELSERHEGTELVAVARRREATLEELALAPPWLVLDHPKSPGNVGSIIRALAQSVLRVSALRGYACASMCHGLVRGASSRSSCVRRRRRVIRAGADTLRFNAPRSASGGVQPLELIRAAHTLHFNAPRSVWGTSSRSTQCDSAATSDPRCADLCRSMRPVWETSIRSTQCDSAATSDPRCADLCGSVRAAAIGLGDVQPLELCAPVRVAGSIVGAVDGARCVGCAGRRPSAGRQCAAATSMRTIWSAATLVLR